MPFKTKLFLGIFSLILALSLVMLWFNTEKRQYQPGISDEADRAVNQAQLLFREAQKQKMNFDSGPCLTNALMPNWVVDIVNNPRQEMDNLPENQCSVYLEGRAEHFVELDMQGNIIRVQ